jgi:hypothetical protein
MQQDTLVNLESALALLILLPVVSVLMRRFGGALAQMARVQETRRILLAAVATLSTGTAFYNFAEGWTWLDSIYFSIVTLATVGYGDLAPKTTGGKIFTIGYPAVGIGILADFVRTIAQIHDEKNR